MAQRRTTHSSGGSENYEILKFCAFWGLILAGIAGLISFSIWFFGLFGLSFSFANRLQGICSMLSSIAALVGVALGGWLYVKYKTKGWKIIYFVAIVCYVLGFFGMGIF